MYHDSLESKGETKEANKLQAEFTNTEYFMKVLIHTRHNSHCILLQLGWGF